MYDILPFPNITATDTKEQVEQINNYLIQFKEDLEFILTNIGVDNLSEELLKKINSLGNNVSTSQRSLEEIQQLFQKGLKVSDVINSQLFKDETIKGVKVNGKELVKDNERMVDVLVPTDYLVDGEQTAVSKESDGINVFTFRYANGDTATLEVKNGSRGEKGDTPGIGFSIDFSTGQLTYIVS